jgi:hypothetical protein
MPRASAYMASDFPSGLMLLVCPRCGRRDEHRKEHIARFGAGYPLASVLVELSACAHGC